MSAAGPRSRLLARTEAELAAALKAGEQLRANELRAQCAVMQVRQGELEQARNTLTALHQAAFASPNPALSAWVNLAEGLMAYYTDFDRSAGDRLQRAAALAKAVGLRAAESQAHAFLAQVRLAETRVEDCGQELVRGFAAADPDDSLARSRLNMVAGMVLHHADEADAAAPWYAKSRAHATAVGDDATLAALLHNIAQYRVSAVRRAAALGRSAQLAGLLPGVQSITNYDAAMGIAVLSVLTPLLRAQVLVVTGGHAEALQLFEQNLPQAMATGLERIGSSLLADTAWCRLQLGQRELALQQARASELELDPACDVDDRAITHSRLAQVFAGLELAADAARHQQQADAAWSEFGALQQRWKAMVLGTGLQPG